MIRIVLRTCDGFSLQTNRMFPKQEILLTCFSSLLNSIVSSDYRNHIFLHVIDDRSNEETRDEMRRLLEQHDIPHELKLIDYNPMRGESVKKASRFTLSIALELIKTFNSSDIVYLVEDDYFHFEDSIGKMIDSYRYFDDLFTEMVGIFPQDFNQLYYDKLNPFNSTYNGSNKGPRSLCQVYPGLDRYFRTSWFSQESFLLSKRLFSEFEDDFMNLLRIGYSDGEWEGSTISKVWENRSVKLLMPLTSFVIHVSRPDDVSNFMVNWFSKYNDEKKKIICLGEN